MNNDLKSTQKLLRDSRFRENLELAREGDEAAISILWIEYGVDFEKEGSRFE